MTTEQQNLMDLLKGDARLVKFSEPIRLNLAKLQSVKRDIKKSKAAKMYYEETEAELRNQLYFLYKAAQEAFPEDKIDADIAYSSLGPENILEHFEFRVIVARK